MLKPLMYLSICSAAMWLGWVAIPVSPSNPAELGQEPASKPETAAPAHAAAPNMTKNPVKPTADSQARAKKVYTIDCEMCHGTSGDGKTDLAKDMKLTLLDWTDAKALAGKSDGDLFDIIKNGKGQMPPEDGRAKTDEMWNLVIYIRHMAKAPDAAPAAQ